MANLTNSAKLIAEMEKKANLTDLPDVYNSTVTVVVNWNTGSNTFSTNQPSNSTLKVTVWKSDVGLWNVDNTSDANKPISTATQAALDLKADKSDISSVYKYKWSVANYESLPSSWQTVWDVYNVEAAHTTAPIFPAWSNLAWDWSAWDVLWGTVDLSNYLAKNNTTAFTPTWDYNPATKKYVDDNITTYNDGEWIEIKNWPDYSAMQWPAPDGFHVPLSTEWQSVRDIRVALGGGSSDWTNFWIALKLPFAGLRDRSSAGVINQGGRYWSSSRGSTNRSYSLSLYSTDLNPQLASDRAYGFSVRCFKNTPTIPTSSWTKLYWTSIEIWWIFWSSTDWLISLSSDWNTWITIADKNLWATTVWNSGDTLSEANMGNMYQWGNNYWFPSTWTISNTSSTQVDARTYWPWNYYSSSTFITRSSSPYDRSSVQNDNLWWWETWVVTLENAITNTGVLSVNWQTGNVTVASPDMSNYLAKNNTTAFTPTWNYNPATKKYVDDTIASAKSSWATAPSNPTEWQLWYDTTNDVLKVYDWTNWVEVGKEYSAGEWIRIWTVHKDTQWPAPDGYHIPLHTEWQSLINVWWDLWFTEDDIQTFITYFHIPLEIARSFTWADDFLEAMWVCCYWSADWDSDRWEYYILYLEDNYPSDNHIEVQTTYWISESLWYPIRAFKDVPVIPDNNWTILHQWTWNAWIFYNSALWVISISWDWINWITVADKNIWATVVYNNWDTISSDNVWYVYQRWNNYWFAPKWTITTSSWSVNASTYWPWNYYSSSTFIKRTQQNNNVPWDSSQNRNLWWWVSKWTWVDSSWTTITNTWVLSVNGQTGDVTINEPTVVSGDSWTTYTIKVSDTAPASWTASNIITFVTD